MYRFSDVKYDAASQTAEIGAGLIWDDVYAALEPHGVNVVGGRVTGVGVAGSTLGGGTSFLSFLDCVSYPCGSVYTVVLAIYCEYTIYIMGLFSCCCGSKSLFFVIYYFYCDLALGYSWLTNQYGLTVDNVVGFELVLPSGDVTKVTQDSNPDLFFALKVRPPFDHVQFSFPLGAFCRLWGRGDLYWRNGKG